MPPSMRPGLRSLVIGGCVVPGVAALDSSDFSNDLFSDLAPLLTLFGERVTMQFLSQAMGWADNIILAMAPLGVITVIVGAIRVGGPRWLRAIIGRATESRAVVEADLMSSTSREVCELWNGQEIVRVMGAGPIREFVILLPEGRSAGRDVSVMRLVHRKEKKEKAKDKAKNRTPGIKAAGESTGLDAWVKELARRRKTKDDTLGLGAGGRSEDGKEVECEAVDNVEEEVEVEEEDNETMDNACQYLTKYEPTFLGGTFKAPKLRLLKPISKKDHQRPHDLERGIGKHQGRANHAEANQGHGLNAKGRDFPEEMHGARGSGGPKGLSGDPSPGKGGGHDNDPVVVIRNMTTDAPNLTINVNNQLSRRELHLAAALGIVLQLGVVIFNGFIVYHRTFSSRWLKDGEPTVAYAYPCNAAGTLLLVIGMLVCAHAVESSSSEERYRPDPAREARVVWLQRHGIVNDQAFESFAVFPQEPQVLVTTSGRGEPHSGIGETVVVIGAAIGVGGFILHFVGLRSMHWSASIAQLIATLIMVALRALVRRKLAKLPISKPLLPGFEMDWLAMTIGGEKGAWWSDAAKCGGKSEEKPEVQQKEHNGESDKGDMKPGKHARPWDWTITAVGNPASLGGLKPDHDTASTGHTPPPQLDGRLVTTRRTYKPFRHSQLEDVSQISDVRGPASSTKRKPAHNTTSTSRIPVPKFHGRATTTLRTPRPLRRGQLKEAVQTHDSLLHGPPQGLATRHNCPQSQPTAQRVMIMRRDFGELTGWQGPASTEAIALARSIEITMDTLFGSGGPAELAWPPQARLNWSLKVRRSLEMGGEFLAPESIAFRVERLETGKWKAYSDELEAALSLWLYSVYERENDTSPDGHMEEVKRENRASSGKQHFDLVSLVSKDDAWLRATGSRTRRNLQVLGPCTLGLLRDLRWWMPDGAAGVAKVRTERMQSDNGSLDDISTIDAKPHRVVGHASNWRPGSSIFQAPLPSTAGQALSESNWALAAESFSSLPVLFARHMFSAFMWTVAKTMDGGVLGKAHTRPLEADGENPRPAWESFALNNDQLHRLAREIQSTGLGTLNEVYLCIIPPLSNQNKLPQVDAIVGWARQHAMSFERLGQWRTAGEVYLWLFETTNTFPETSEIATRAIIALMVFSRTVASSIKLRRDLQLEDWDLKLVESRLHAVPRDELKGSQFHGLSDIIEGLYDFQMPHEKISWPQEQDDAILELGTYHRLALEDRYALEDTPLNRQRDGGFNVKDLFDWTPLHYAAAKGSITALEGLLDPPGDADINARDLRERTPLHCACRRGDPLAVQRLLRNGADMNILDAAGRTPAHYAAIHGHRSVMTLLVEAGASIDVVDGIGLSPLHWSAFKARKHVFELLEDANVKLRDHHGRTALHLAAMGRGDTGEDIDEDRKDIIEALIRKTFSSTEAVDRFGRTALHYAVQGGVATIIKALLNMGAPIESEDHTGSTPLHLAAKSESVAAIEILVDKGATVDANNRNLDTPLHLAAMSESEAAIKTLLDNGAAINRQNAFGEAPLHLAAMSENAAPIKTLLESGAAINPKQKSGSTPLHVAAWYGYVAVIKALLEKGALINAKDDDDETPLDHALIGGNEGAVRELRSWGAKTKGEEATGVVPDDDDLSPSMAASGQPSAVDSS